jgi:predicted transcriptional regulator
MLSVEQYKAIELLVTGHTVNEAAREVEVTAQTVRSWMRTNAEFIEELSRATDTFSKECIKSRSRAYRTLNKQILDKIFNKIEENQLDDLDIETLIGLLNKTVTIMRTDEDVKKMPTTAIQNNIQINNDIKSKMEQEEFARKFGEFLNSTMSAEDLNEIAQAKQKVDRQAEREKK